MAIPESRWMTYGEAKAKIRRYYVILEAVQEFKLKSGDLVIIVERTGNTTAPQEQEVIRKLDMLESVSDVAKVLPMLTEEQRRFCELRYRDQFGFRQIARELHRALSSLPAFETQTLDVFISAIGCIPKV